jgi:hypothetical protein
MEGQSRKSKQQCSKRVGKRKLRTLETSPSSASKVMLALAMCGACVDWIAPAVSAPENFGCTTSFELLELLRNPETWKPADASKNTSVFHGTIVAHRLRHSD